MRSKGFLRFVRMFAVAPLVLLMATSAWSASYKVLYNFNSTNANPSSGLITDGAGNGYGTTAGGGHDKSGTVYELSPKTGYHLLYAFSNSGPGGRQPQGNLVFDSAGNLYGTTVYGGANKTACNNRGCGVVFELSPPTGGGLWTETVLYSFCAQANCADGANPQAGVTFDMAGSLYGTTETGGNQNCQDHGPGCGIVFELQTSQSGWTESILYGFTGGSAGLNPLGGLILDTEGNLYGTTGDTVFEMTLGTGGQWVASIIHHFNRNGDGTGAAAGLIFDATGNLYGTTAGGGEFGTGIVFELTPNAGGWTETILYSFMGGNDGAMPESSLVFDSLGSLYGTTFAGGGSKGCLGNGCGTVFKLTPGTGGQWTESLFRFNSTLGVHGTQPTAPVLLDAAGNVYGTTTAGGRGIGVAFRITQ